MLRQLMKKAETPVDITGLVYFRVAYGALMFLETVRLLLGGIVKEKYLDPVFHFTYYGFDWVRVPPAPVLYGLFVLIAVAALCVALGLFTRAASAVFFLGFGYVFLLDETYYLNHYYLILLLAFLLVFLPSNRAFSLDARIWPSIRSETVPALAYAVLVAQLSCVYVFAGMAKVNADWLLRGQPMGEWLYGLAGQTFMGPFFAWSATPLIFSYGGALFDLLIVPALFWRRTRLAAFGFVTLFHLMNVFLFEIGVFPWLMIAATILLFPRIEGWKWPKAWKAADQANAPATSPRRRWILVGLLAAYFAVQLLLPLRHWLYPGDAAWTGEGHRFSWRMMLRSRRASNAFFVTDRISGVRTMVELGEYLTHSQIVALNQYPDTIPQFSRLLAAEWARKGHPYVVVQATIRVSLNGADMATYVNPNTDLSKEPRTLWPAKWIMAAP